MKQASCNGSLHQPVSITGDALQEKPAGVMTSGRPLIFHTDEDGHRIRGLAQLRPWAVNPPTRPRQQRSGENNDRLQAKTYGPQEACTALAFA
ncbi:MULTISPECIES: hypothetical protein [unclassified Synechococcus]|uniref:hypothetical protein n=1 Tax=unclassified Synechococcus TaxID=2626047 RepID=UPI0012E79A69|nr:MULTISPECIES: hypothetical protein [unclassified Synechococcus]